ncbi:NAC domain-containing protein 89-like [Impatiens glandulifera]|uniref:NAC domain-containing protein 89-like n=1 Tax=Impatiens glandulifera TaxID=253017 RepID=UPI001FB0F766|nr:NAC domain-containing protein 89-like [Impatiens glandulifera]
MIFADHMGSVSRSASRYAKEKSREKGRNREGDREKSRERSYEKPKDREEPEDEVEGLYEHECRRRGQRKSDNHNNGRGVVVMEEEKMSKLEFDHMMIKMSSRFPGFKFSPGDEELISFYLRKKIVEMDELVSIIPEIEINNFEPWDLPAKCSIYSESEWYYFSPRGRKYPNGSQSKRATESGYWKATGKERNVKSGSTVIGTKRTLVFHTGRAPNGERTEWIMHEYGMKGQSKVSS